MMIFRLDLRTIVSAKIDQQRELLFAISCRLVNTLASADNKIRVYALRT